MAVQDLVNKQIKGILNIVGDERISKYSFGVAVANQFDLDPAFIQPSRILDQSRLVLRPKDTSLSNLRACTLLHRSFGSVSSQLRTLKEQGQNWLSQDMVVL